MEGEGIHRRIPDIIGGEYGTASEGRRRRAGLQDQWDVDEVLVLGNIDRPGDPLTGGWTEQQEQSKDQEDRFKRSHFNESIRKLLTSDPIKR